MVITNIYFRLVLGTFSILLGLMFLKMRRHRGKYAGWGHFHRILEQSGHDVDKIYLIIGCFSILAGIVVLLFGFRMVMVGT